MSHELWDSVEKIVRELGEEIERNEPQSRLKQPNLGWQYQGQVFQAGTDGLKREMKKKGYNVSCSCPLLNFLCSLYRPIPA